MFLKEKRRYNSERIRHRVGKNVVHIFGTQISVTSQDRPGPSNCSVPPATGQTYSDNDVHLSDFSHKMGIKGKKNLEEKQEEGQ